MKAPITFLQGTIIAIVAPIILLTIFIIFSNRNIFGMVEADYYQKELDYQSQIDRQNQTKQLGEDVKFVYNNSVVVLEFPKIIDSEQIEGEILFFRSSDPSKDFKLMIGVDEGGKQYINVSEIVKGAWIIKVYWNTQEDKYYSEKRIFLQGT